MDEIDVLVVGAGILGMASAYHILHNNRNKRVLVVDRYGAPGQGNTGRSNAMFRNTFSSRDNQILANASIDFYAHSHEEMHEDIGLQKIGYLWLMSEEQLGVSRPYLEGMERNNIEFSEVDKATLLSRFPSMRLDGNGGETASLLELPKIEAGIFGPKCGRLDPDKLVRFYARRFEEMGGRFSFGTSIAGIGVGPRKRVGIEGEPFVWQESKVDSVQVEGRISGILKPKTVVLACGAWGNQILNPVGIDGHVKAKKRQLFSIQAQGNADLERIERADGFNSLSLAPLVILPKSGVHFKPVSEEGAIWVACEDEVNRPYIDSPDADLEKYQAEPAFYEKSIKPVLSGYFPDFEGAKIKAMWAGLYSYNTVDFLPFVFKQDNLIVVGGDSGSGIMKGDSLGRIVDAVYREEEEAELFGGIGFRASKLSFDQRDVEREEWVI